MASILGESTHHSLSFVPATAFWPISISPSHHPSTQRMRSLRVKQYENHYIGRKIFKIICHYSFQVKKCFLCIFLRGQFSVAQ